MLKRRSKLPTPVSFKVKNPVCVFQRATILASLKTKQVDTYDHAGIGWYRIGRYAKLRCRTGSAKSRIGTSLQAVVESSNVTIVTLRWLRSATNIRTFLKQVLKQPG